MKWTYFLVDDLVVSENGKAFLQAHTVWGLLRGLESFAQLVHNVKDSGYLVRKNIILCQAFWCDFMFN